MNASERVLIGKVQGTHGVRGQFKVQPLTDFPERFFDMEELSLYREGKLVGTFAVTKVQDALVRNHVIVTAEGITTMEQAEELRGCTVEISKEERVPLEPGEFWISDLIGLNAFDDEGNSLGLVKDVVDNGSGQLLVITDSEGKEHMIPAVPDFFLDASLETGRITLHLIDGLWNL